MQDLWGYFQESKATFQIWTAFIGRPAQNNLMLTGFLSSRSRTGSAAVRRWCWRFRFRSRPRDGDLQQEAVDGQRREPEGGPTSAK